VSRPRRWWAIVLALGLVAVSPAARAQERQLNEGHPTRLDDAFPIAAGDATVLLTSGVRVPQHGAPVGVFPLDVQYALLPNTQLSVGTVLTTAPHETSDPGSGDLNVAARVALGRESTFLPTLAAQLGVNLPTGVGSRATDVQLKGLATRSLTVGLLPLLVHFNAAVDFRATQRSEDERLARYHLVAGASFALPQQATTTVVGDVFADQSVRRGEAETVGLELGLRHRLTSRIAIGGAVGTEIAGPGGRAPVLARLGMSFDFDVPAFRKPPP
jgi:hypothetical protein